MPRRDIVVLDASDGGVSALQTVLRALPAGLPAAVFVVLHRNPAADGMLSELTDRAVPV